MQAHPTLPAGARAVHDPDDPREFISGLAVREDGTVLRWHNSYRKWVVLKHRIDSGSCQIRIRVGERVDNKMRSFNVARLVLRAFVGPSPIGCVALRWPDQNPINNQVSNLRWAPRGTSRIGSPGVKGESHTNSILTESDIHEIRRLYRAGTSQADIAECLEITKPHVHKVLNGKSWAHVPDPLGPITTCTATGENNSLSKLDWEQVSEIRAMAAQGAAHRALGRKFGVHGTTIGQIVRGETWKQAPDV